MIKNRDLSRRGNDWKGEQFFFSYKDEYYLYCHIGLNRFCDIVVTERKQMSVPSGAAGALRRSLRRNHVPSVRGHPGALPARGLRRRRPLRTDNTRRKPRHRVRLHRRRWRLCGLRRRQPSQRGTQS